MPEIFKNNPFRRRLLFATIFAGICLTGVLGIAKLHGIFQQERLDARNEFHSRQKALVQYAGMGIRQKLQQALDIARQNILEAYDDPLLPAANYIYVQNGRQRLPRVINYSQSEPMRAQVLYKKLMDASVLDLVSQSFDPWNRRLDLFSEFKASLENADPDEVRWSFRRLREYYSRGAIQASQDIPYILAVVDYFIQNSQPNMAILRGLIRGGTVVDREEKRFGLQRLLLKHRNNFSRQDFHFFATRIVALSELAGVKVLDFKLRSTDPRQILPDLSHVNQPSLVADGKWYVAPTDTKNIIGIEINMAEIKAHVQNEMRDLGLLTSQESITLSLNYFQPADLLPVNIVSRHWSDRARAIDKQFFIKSTLLYSSGLLMVVIVLLILTVQQRTRRSFEQKSEFFAAVSHELLTPLSSVRLLTETLMRKINPNTRNQEYLHRIVNDIDQLKYLVGNILSFNRLNKAAWKPQKERLPLTELIETVKKSTPAHTHSTVGISAKGIKGIYLNADPELMKILFNNMVSNACKYNGNDPVKIFVTVGTNEIYVRDNGIGIDKDLWEQVFQEFYRNIKIKNRPVRGSGLGLAICKKIMQLHGGQIHIAESNAYGTLFAVQFNENDFDYEPQL